MEWESKKRRTLCKVRDYAMNIFYSLLSAFYARLSGGRAFYALINFKMKLPLS